MGMPITIEIRDADAGGEIMKKIFDYFTYVDEKFSTYKDQSEITNINRGIIKESEWSDDMRLVLDLCRQTKTETDGYFDIVNREGLRDPSGLVKGWSIWNAAKIAEKEGLKNFYIEAGGDIQTGGINAEENNWRVGIKNPFNPKEIVKVLLIENQGVATSGTYIRGQHVWNPKDKNKPINDIISLTVVGPNIYEADRFATAAFAMGREGIGFIEKRDGLEGYQIDKNGTATMTTGFQKYAV